MTRAAMTTEEIKAIARKDPRLAMDFVVRAHRDRLIRHATSILKDPERAADLVHEVFLKAMREPRFFEPEFRMGAWLYRVTHNLSLNRLRDSRRRQEILASQRLRPVQRARQLDDLTDAQQGARLRALMDQLSVSHRQVLQARYFDDLSYLEIADRLGIKLGTVMSRLSRAKSRLGELVPEEWLAA